MDQVQELSVTSVKCNLKSLRAVLTSQQINVPYGVSLSVSLVFHLTRLVLCDWMLPLQSYTD